MTPTATAHRPVEAKLPAWLAQHSGEWVTPPPAGAPERGYPALGDAPETYVFST